MRLDKHEKADSHVDLDKITKVTKFTDVITPTMEKYLQHARQNPLLKYFDLKRTMVSMPICMRCERITNYDRRPGDPPPIISINPETGYPVKSKPYVTCYYCGYHGPGGPPAMVHVKEV